MECLTTLVQAKDALGILEATPWQKHVERVPSKDIDYRVGLKKITSI